MTFNMKPFFRLALVLFALAACNAFAQANDTGVLSDMAYGKHKKQVLDIYYPATKPKNAPVIFMVHGGAWRVGNKASKSVVKNKVAHWVPSLKALFLFLLITACCQRLGRSNKLKISKKP